MQGNMRARVRRTPGGWWVFHGAGMLSWRAFFGRARRDGGGRVTSQFVCRRTCVVRRPARLHRRRCFAELLRATCWSEEERAAVSQRRSDPQHCARWQGWDGTVRKKNSPFRYFGVHVPSRSPPAGARQSAQLGVSAAPIRSTVAQRQRWVGSVRRKRIPPFR